MMMLDDDCCRDARLMIFGTRLPLLTDLDNSIFHEQKRTPKVSINQ